MKPFDWEDFEVGFWQAFGPFGGMTPEDIIRSKDDQLSQAAWTLWSFSASSQESTLRNWLEWVSDNDPWVLLSYSRGAAEPEGRKSAYRIAREYREIDGEWKPIPKTARTGLYLKPGTTGAAYVVRQQTVLRHGTRQEMDHGNVANSHPGHPPS
jgi:hypothetical protein